MTDKYQNLNVGSGELMWPQYINFDMRMHKRTGTQTDVIGDINYLPFKPNTFSNIVCSHVIEHFYKTDAIALITEMFSLLAPGGLLMMEGPCMLGCYWYYHETKKDTERFIDFIYGGEDNRLKYGDEYAHRSGWTGPIMSKTMEFIGFKIEIVGIGRFHGMGCRDFRVEGRKEC